ncbi:MAG: 30S ribosomal protein S4 [Candidatus Moranbacteria bacterium CG10_big_fil_rev_8_21_14_0_10_35_21]|nr:MAG: 30S ribosomal protein S4 [Candidatus Moranbacteria bacterium CG10_big_fil_rev_8_21_14_0_10_35_21]PJA88540.1 MAG: 30S ribosomal protein S4 [Candidatus Moranbacteria bacterium CG_4_9_14_3_um_filter_36_9]
MARNLDAKCRKCRRSGEKLFLKGDRCFSPKCGFIRKAYAPGMHGKKKTRGGQSEFGHQLAVKQKIKRIYGILERQFHKHFEEVKNKPGVTGDLLLQRLEMRLDNVVYRMGFASSRAQARQLVNHGLIKVNGKKVTIPSFKAKISDIISVNEVKQEKTYSKNLEVIIKNKKDFPSWISFDNQKMEGKIVSTPVKDEIGINVDVQVVVESYSR